MTIYGSGSPQINQQPFVTSVFTKLSKQVGPSQDKSLLIQRSGRGRRTQISQVPSYTSFIATPDPCGRRWEDRIEVANIYQTRNQGKKDAGRNTCENPAALPANLTLLAYPQPAFRTDSDEKDLHTRVFETMKLPGRSQEGINRGGSKLPPPGAPPSSDLPSSTDDSDTESD